MAKIQLGPIISSISGSIGGTTFNRRRGHTAAYARPLPGRHPSSAQLFHRQAVASAATAWGALTPSIRQAWDFIASEKSIPDSFTQGRRWTGRQVFTCFFLHAKHQYTPLPPDWLPTFPYFFQTDRSIAKVYFPSQEDTEDPEVFRWVGAVDFLFSIPLSLNPSEVGGETTSVVSCFWLSLVKIGQRTGPRQWYKVAPLPPSVFQSSMFGWTGNSGNPYSQWYDGLEYAIGTIPGMDYAYTDNQPRPFDIALRATALTDKRLYFQAPAFFKGSDVGAGTSPLLEYVNSQRSVNDQVVFFNPNTYTYPGHGIPEEP